LKIAQRLLGDFLKWSNRGDLSVLQRMADEKGSRISPWRKVKLNLDDRASMKRFTHWLGAEFQPNALVNSSSSGLLIC